MLDRRTFGGLLTGAAFWPALARAQGARRTTPFYDGVGANLTVYDLDVEAASLAPRAVVTLPSNLQYAWPDPARRFLYVVTSANAANPDANAGTNFALVFQIDPATGALTPHGQPVALRQRALFVTVDHRRRYMFTAYSAPALLTVHRINSDGTIGEEVPQTANLDFGIFAHQARVSPSGKTVILVTRGNNPAANKPEDPGAIKIFGLDEGKLSNIASLAPGGNGLGFGPRHLDFDPGGRFAYVSVERNNRLDVYGLKPDGTLTSEALFMRSSLGNPDDAAMSTGPAAIHAHPNGRIVYLSNRASRLVDYQGKRVLGGGENNIAVFSIDRKSGAPTLVQTVEGHGVELRTFAMDPRAKILIAASQNTVAVRDGDNITTMSAGLSIYRIADDGKLIFVRKQDVDTRQGSNIWCGTLAMA